MNNNINKEHNQVHSGYKESQLNHSNNSKFPWWIIILLIVGGILFVGFVIIGIIVNVIESVSNGQHTETPLQEVHINEYNTVLPDVLVIDVNGIIMPGETTAAMNKVPSSLMEEVLLNIKYAKTNPRIKGIILKVNSPGGAIGPCDVIYNELTKLKKERPNIKILAYWEDVAASGGVYVSMASDEIIAAPTTITGSIGVIMSFYNFTELFNKWGIQNVTIKSGQFKDIGSVSRNMSPEENEILKKTVMELYDRFVNIVANGRKNLSKEAVLNFADGRVFLPKEALKYGLIDKIGYFTDAQNEIARLVNANEVNLIKYIKTPSLIEELIGIKVESNKSFEKLLTKYLNKDGVYFLYLFSLNKGE